jgi:hypothetical protein
MCVCSKCELRGGARQLSGFNNCGEARASSWTSRVILREGVFGLHCGLSGHARLSRDEAFLIAVKIAKLPSVPRLEGYSAAAKFGQPG